MRMLTALALAFAAFAAGCASAAEPPVSSAPAEAARPGTLTIFVAIDGFRADYLDRGLTPNLARLASAGVRYLDTHLPKRGLPLR